MTTPPSSPAPSRLGTFGWLWQAITGAALIFLAGLHMVAQHFVAEGGLRDFAAVQAYLRQPVILALEVFFLLAVTTHALLGVRAVLFDLGLSDAAEKRLTQLFALLGLATIAYGLWLTWSILAFPAA